MIGTIRASTSKKLQNFSQHTCTALLITRLGREVSLALARRASTHRRLSASPASMHASDEPTVEVPIASAGRGACQSSARIVAQRCSISAVCGYSSLSTMFLSKDCVYSLRASGSIQVVTKVARLSRALPSSIVSSRTTW